MKKNLIAFCKSLGIENIGIAPVEIYKDFESIYEKQIERGHICGFEEKNIEKRINPYLTLEDAKSIIVCLFPYYSGSKEGSNIAKYAYSIDYHIIVKRFLEIIAGYLQDRIDGFHYKTFVDIGPLSDRYIAYKAGLGFLGINNHIITDRYGSYFFIGYIINNYHFKPDVPQNRTCIQCFECVKACPGQCISDDFTINPLRCKSFITQKKGQLSDSEITILKKNNLIWGCDVCQDICPHNKNIEKTNIKEFKENLIYSIQYDELKQMTNKEFIEKYGNRAFSWRGKGILLRNYEIINDLKIRN